MSSQKKDKATYDMETKKYKQETAQTPILTWGEGGRCEAIAIRLEATAIRLEAIAIRQRYWIEGHRY